MIFLKCRFLFLIISIFFVSSLFARTVKYDLNIDNKPLNLSGKEIVPFPILVNGSIPGPTLEFNEGDYAEITVHNKLTKEEVSIHWHGILLPTVMDGVPYVNTPPIFPGESFTFKFKIRQHGTYWYHSHTSLQEQKGVFGALVIHPENIVIETDHDIVLVLSDWSDENPDDIMNNLRKDGDYYMYKKKSVRSYLGAIKNKSFHGFLKNEWIRMAGMDLSDVGYDAFLINGKIEHQILFAHPGERVRLRIINAAASTYFHVALGDIDMNVISSDGLDVSEALAKEIFIGMAETYDVLFTIPDHKNYEFKITSQDNTGSASAWIGSGDKIYAPVKKQPNLYVSMNDDGLKKHPQHISSISPTTLSKNGEDTLHLHKKESNDQTKTSTTMSTEKVLSMLSVDDLRSKTKTSFSPDKNRHDLELVLGGDMERYIWHINGKAIYEDRNISINEGDVVRITFINETMMHHPMHLHGHFFRVLNNHDEYSPLKHTVDVPPHGSRTIEFFADEPGQWMLHCHNLYHLKTGMARVVKYNSFTPEGLMATYDKKDPHLLDHIYLNGMVEAATNHAQVFIRLSKTWDTLEARFETREYDNLDHAEGDLFYRRWVSNFFNIIAGGTHYAEFDNHETRGIIGIGYMLPMMIETNLLIDHRGKYRLDIERKFQWTQYIHSDLDLVLRQDQDAEIEITLMYANNWAWSAGLMFTEDTVGVGVEYNF